MSADHLPAVTAAVEGLHALFEGWFLGTADDLSPCEQTLAADFELVTPIGDRMARGPLLELLRAGQGRHAGTSFAIHIEDVRARTLGGGLHLVTYQEWHVQGGARRGRLSTALLREDGGAPGGFTWLHVHETWLPS